MRSKGHGAQGFPDRGHDCSGLEFHEGFRHPKPDPDERVLTKAWVEWGLSLPCSEFFLSVRNTYGLQPHNICPNSYLLLSNFVTLCKGHLGIRPDIRLWQFFFRIKKETNDKVSGVHEGLPKFINKPPEELAIWSFVPALVQYPELDKAAQRISWNPTTTTARANIQKPITREWDLEQDLLNSMLNNAWGKVDTKFAEIQNFKKEIGQFCDQLLITRKEQQALHYELHKNIALQRCVTLSQADKIRVAKEKIAELEKQLAGAQGAYTYLAVASSELETMRSANKDLESKLAEA
ncbi:hypothetical protein QYE76_050472 [Lolium multiflorum]|uniref:Transposase (putative) gypsy type domain-containing protein n=1 Tax=Lolium multiflorum TaxID=4521 RepID=A0AAD8SRY4_LOLMU|nr:hypothetical protein QYE76_050472 [Lolium multiflorum]